MAKAVHRTVQEVESVHLSGSVSINSNAQQRERADAAGAPTSPLSLSGRTMICIKWDVIHLGAPPTRLREWTPRQIVIQ